MLITAEELRFPGARLDCAVDVRCGRKVVKVGSSPALGDLLIYSKVSRASAKSLRDFDKSSPAPGLRHGYTIKTSSRSQQSINENGS